MTRPLVGEPRDPVLYVENWQEIGDLSDAVPTDSWRRGGLDDRVLPVTEVSRVFSTVAPQFGTMNLPEAPGGPYTITDQTDMTLLNIGGQDMQVDLNLSAADVGFYRLRVKGHFGTATVSGTRLDVELTIASLAPAATVRIPGSYWSNGFAPGIQHFGGVFTVGLIATGTDVINVRMRARSVGGDTNIQGGSLIVEMFRI